MVKQRQLKWCESIFDADVFVVKLLNKGCHNIRVSYSAKRDLTMAWLVTWLNPHQPNLTGKSVKITQIDYENAEKEIIAREVV